MNALNIMRLIELNAFDNMIKLTKKRYMEKFLRRSICINPALICWKKLLIIFLEALTRYSLRTKVITDASGGNHFNNEFLL